MARATIIQSDGSEVAQNPEFINFSSNFSAALDNEGGVDVDIAQTGFTVTNTTTANTISVDQNGNVGTDVSTDGAIHVENTGNTGIGLSVYSNVGATAAAELVSIKANNVAFDEPAVVIAQEGNAYALEVAWRGDENNSKFGVIINNSGSDAFTGDGAVAYIKTVNSSDTGRTLLIEGAGTNVSATVVDIRKAGTGTGSAIRIVNSGTGAGLFVDNDGAGTGNAIEIDMDGNNAADIYGIKVVADNAGAGVAGGIDLSGFAAGEPTINFVDGNASTIDPSATAESGWINIAIGGVVKYIPYYAAS